MVAAIGCGVAGRVVTTQDKKLLSERVSEAAALLANATESVGSSLRMLGAVGSVPETGAFAPSASSLADSPTTTVAVVAERGTSFAVLAAVGPDAKGGAMIGGSRAVVLRRAYSRGALVTGVFHDGAATKLLIAVPGAAATGTVAYRETLITPRVPIPAPRGSPYQELRAAVYASGQPSRDSLLLTTDENPPLRGAARRVSIGVGVDTWTLLASARQPLVGGFARLAPLGLLAVGLLTAVLAAGVVEAVSRRQLYAEQLVDDRTRELQRAQQEAESANQAKNMFLSRMSHELRTPLNAVLGFGQLLELEPLTDDQRGSVSQIMRGGRHLLDLINEVLDISRIESGNLGLSPEPVEVGEVVATAMSLMAPVAARAGIRLELADEQPSLAYVYADRQRLQQILLNLLSNAVKYNCQGGTARVGVEVIAGDGVRIDVTDEGAGFAAADMAAVFAPFERLSQPGQPVEGTGIGLALSRQLAEAMDGTLGVTSSVGEGSTFSLTLPQSAAPGPVDPPDVAVHVDPAAPSALPADRPRAGTRRILHVEDNPANLELVERILSTRPDVSLIGAPDGHAAVEAVHAQLPALVLLDLHLPDMDGSEVLRILKSDPRTADIPVVIVSADVAGARRNRLLRAGAAAYLDKPLDVGKFMQLIDRFAAGAMSRTAQC